MPEKWERQENETQKNYNLFCVYRDMGITRTIAKVVQKLNRPERYRGHLSNLSAEYKWVDRCNAYDNYMDEENRKANVEAVKKMNEEIIVLSRQLRQIPGVRLKSIVDKIRVAYESQDAARIEEATKDIPLYLVPQLIETSFMLERKARGVRDGIEVDATVKHTVDPGEVKTKILSKLRSLEDDADSGNTSQAPEK
jgi:hypothetical protein